MSFEGTKVGIRPLTEADIDSVFSLATALAGAPDWPRQRYEEALQAQASRRRIALVACDPRSTGLAGLAIASLIPPEAELESIAVARNLQRQGIGRQLFHALTAELRQQGVAELLLEARASNLPALAFYRAENFKQTGVRPYYYADPQEDAVLMSLRLF
jgi:[ribosomal protein S18]-alanine N-acetyltransferase